MARRRRRAVVRWIGHALAANLDGALTTLQARSGVGAAIVGPARVRDHAPSVDLDQIGPTLLVAGIELGGIDRDAQAVHRSGAITAMQRVVSRGRAATAR
jgi:hypothetical protein